MPREAPCVRLDRLAARYFYPLSVDLAIVVAKQQAMIGPMSSGTPARPGAVLLAMNFFISRLSRTTPWLKSVSIAPAATTLAAIPREFLRHMFCQHLDHAFHSRRRHGGTKVPSFAREWRTRQDSNLWPLPSEGNALSS